MGAAAGLFLAVLLLRGLNSWLDPAMIPVNGFALDPLVLAFTAGLTLLTSLLFGALPALAARRIDLAAALARSGRTVAGGDRRLRQALVAAEVALTVVLLAAAGLFLRNLVHLATLPPGFDPQGVLTAKASVADQRYRDPAAFQALLDRSLAAMRRIPAVQSAAFGLTVPYETPLNDYITSVDGPAAGRGDACSMTFISPDYLTTLRIPLLAGRPILASDTAASRPVALVNVAFGRHFFGAPMPLGRHFRVGSQVYAIVGIVADTLDQSNVRRTAPLGTEPIFYIPAAQVPAGLLAAANLWLQPSWIVRTSGSIGALVAPMQQALSQADPALPFSGFYSMQALRDHQLQLQRTEVALLGVLAALALLLSAVGIFALVSSLVVLRTREIGIRLALGARPGRTMLLVGRAGLVAAVVGAGTGLALAVVVLRGLRSEVYGVGVDDPLALLGSCALLLAVALVAGYLPTARIARLDPAQTLRQE